MLVCSAWNLVESKFLVPAAPLTRWGCVVFADPQRDAPPPAVLAFFKDMLLKQAALRGTSLFVDVPARTQILASV